MGCSSSTAAMDAIMDQPVKRVDHRLPFDHYRQLFNWRNTWKAVTRTMEVTSVDMLIRFFRRYPDYQKLHPDLKDITEEEKKRTSLSFEIAGTAIFTLIDDMMNVIENADSAIDVLNEAGAKHAKYEGFKAKYLRHLKKPWMEALQECLEDRFNENAQINAFRVFDFVVDHMTDGFMEAKGDGYEESEDEEEDEEDETTADNTDNANKDDTADDVKKANKDDAADNVNKANKDETADDINKANKDDTADDINKANKDETADDINKANKDDTADDINKTSDDNKVINANKASNDGVENTNEENSKENTVKELKLDNTIKDENENQEKEKDT